MRYINLDKLRMPDGWLNRSQAAQVAIAQGDDPEDYSAVWKELKPAMSAMSSSKCWYCESPLDRNDGAVDHFRPKKRVAEALNAHSGYRWLAMEKNNFRFACTFCNSRRIDVEFGTAGGKADRFPLINEANRVYLAGSTDAEEPELGDPCDIQDCDLLGCQQENGKPCAATQDNTQVKRVLTSIEVYHLDRDATCVRRHTIAVGLIADILDAKRLFTLSQTDATRKPDFLRVAKKIQSCISSDAIYSGEMKYIIRGQRSDQHPWVQQILEA